MKDAYAVGQVFKECGMQDSGGFVRIRHQAPSLMLTCLWKEM
jgi:hypothetical protein